MNGMAYHERIKRFLITGGSVALVNFLVITILIELLGFNSYFLKNLANILAIEISAFYNFLISRQWTWIDAPKKQGKGLFAQFISFNLAALTGIGFRIVLFPILDNLGVFYLLNVALGIGIAACIGFFLYDKLVFRREGHRKELVGKFTS